MPPVTRLHQPEDHDFCCCPPNDLHVVSDLAKAKKGQPFSPIRAVRGELPHDYALVLADGYHRVCASYSTDENTDIPVTLAARE